MATKKHPKGYGWIPLDKLVECTWNYKTDDPEMDVKLQANMEKNKQVENLIVREMKGGKFEVVNGNHRLRILQKMEAEKAMCYNCGKISDEAAELLATETNETRYASDPLKLSALINRIAQVYPVSELAMTLPYTEAQIENYCKLSEFDWESSKQNEEDTQGNEGSDDGMPPPEDFESIRIPVSLIPLWQEQIDRMRLFLVEFHGREITGDIQPIELMLATLHHTPDATIVQTMA